MRAEEWIAKIAAYADGEAGMASLKTGVPLGVDGDGEIVLAQKREKPFTMRHICVTGDNRTEFIKRLLVTLACLYEKDETSVLVVSPRLSYGELLSLKRMDVHLPMITQKAELAAVKTCICELVELRTREKKCPRLILVLDGLEELAACNENGDLEEYRSFFELLARRADVDIITGAELMQSIFSGYPGAFVGVGNCLVTTHDEDRADVTYVGDDSSLSLPIAIRFAAEPSLQETAALLNASPEP